MAKFSIHLSYNSKASSSLSNGLEEGNKSMIPNLQAKKIHFTNKLSKFNNHCQTISLKLEWIWRQSFPMASLLLNKWKRRHYKIYLVLKYIKEKSLKSRPILIVKQPRIKISFTKRRSKLLKRSNRSQRSITKN